MNGLRIFSRFLRWVAPLVPSHVRGEWLREWEGELWHYWATREATMAGLAGRIGGAIPHAIWLRRDEWRLSIVKQDVTFALRGIRKRPAFATLVVAMLAVGIGSATAMFTIVNSVLLEPLPYPQAERLLVINGATDKIPLMGVSAPDLIDYRAQNTAFSSLAGYSSAPPVVLSGQDEAQQLTVMEVSANYFATLGVAPFLGRAFQDDEDAGAERAILSYQLWRLRFAEDRNVVGRTIKLDGRPTQVVGIMPPVLDRTLGVEIFRPFNFHSPHSSVRAYHTVSALGRLKPGVTADQAAAAMNLVAKRLEAAYPEDATMRVRLRSYQEVATGGSGRIVLPLFGAVLMVLLIACGNTASLLLGRAATRGPEIATRIALGATRTDLARLLLTESLLLSLTGGGLGVGLAVVGVRTIHSLARTGLPRLGEVAVDTRVLLFAVTIAVCTGLLFGVAPVMHVVDKTFGKSPNSIRSRRSRHFREVVVATQVALSLILLVGAGLMLRSLSQLRAVDRGIKAEGVLTARLSLPTPRYNAATQAQFWDEFLRDIRAIPGVRDAAGAMRLATAPGGGNGPFWAEGHAPANDAAAQAQTAQRNVISDRYFSTMGIPVLDGVSFDDPANRPADGVIINQHIAKLLFPGEQAVGRHLIAAFGPPTPLLIVGVVGDVRTVSEPLDVMYFPAPQMPGFLDRLTLNVRTVGDPTRIAPAIRQLLAARDREVPLTQVKTMTDAVDDEFTTSRSISGLLTAFALTALTLALIGVYGALAYMVELRTRELGIRTALGAQRRQLFALIVTRGMTVVGIGVAIGIVGALAATRLIGALLYHVTPTDPVVFALTAATLAIAGLVASALPARRAMTVDPQVALRAE